jgi:hypothetical protein
VSIWGQAGPGLGATPPRNASESNSARCRRRGELNDVGGWGEGEPGGEADSDKPCDP